MPRVPLLASAAALGLGLALADGVGASPAEPAIVETSAGFADDDAVCEPSDVECALSLRQLRATALEPDGASDSPAAGAAGEGSEPTSLAETLHKKKNIKTLYHLTSPHICNLIKAGGFKPGSNGWCGGGIYFAATQSSVWSKAVGVNSHTGCMLKARVDVGKVKEMGPTCDLHMTGEKLFATEHDSIKFNPGDGIEYVIYDPKRVLSVQQVWHDPKAGKDDNGLAPVRVDPNGKPIPQLVEEESPADPEVETTVA